MSSRNRTWPFAAVAVAAACSVFPDEAPPAPPSDTGAAGQGASNSEAGAGSTEPAAMGGAAGDPSSGGAAVMQAGNAGQATVAGSANGGSGGVAGNGGVAGAAGAGGSGGVAGAGGKGGAGGSTGGGGGQSGGCKNPRRVRAPALEDTWISSANPSDNHGDETSLSLVAGADELRTLIALDLPVALAGAVLEHATLRFHLLSNADAGKAARTLALYHLTRVLNETRATWDRYLNGGKKWTSPGGDFDVMWAQVAIPAGTSSGNVDFDVTATVKPLLGTAAIPMSLIVLESSAARPAPAELAFTSTEGNASQIPELLLDYCDP